MLFSIYQFSIVRHLMPSGAKKKKYKTSKNREVGSHEFSQNQKIVADGFLWSLGTELKNCLPWHLKS